MTYGKTFAQVYNTYWSGFAQAVAPKLLAFYAGTEAGQRRLPVLDLCCGTGQLAVHFLQAGFKVIGIDLSPHMLAHARENAREWVATGQAQFRQGDAADFALEEPVGLCVSTFDALNHLPDEEALARCFRCVYQAVAPGGWFVFDLNTRTGLAQRWNGIQVTDRPDVCIIERGFYDGQGRRAWMKVTGFVPTEAGLYERFEELHTNTAFAMDVVGQLLRAAGWHAHPARLDDLSAPLADPEAEGRVWWVAHR